MTLTTRPTARRTVRRGVWIALAVAGAACAADALPDHVGDAAAVDRIFAELDRSDGPGAAVLAVRDGAVVYRNGFGMADLEQGTPIEPTTVFDIASVSKQFAGIAIASLVEAGAVDLHEDIRTYLPEMPDFGATITVEHLVHHTSGLRDWPGTLAVAGWRMDDVISFEQILGMARTQEDLNFEPGAEYSYSNTGYNLLAEIVARVSGVPFRAWTETNVFDPLGMHDTHFQDDHTEVVAKRAHGYQRAGAGWANVPNGLTALGSSSLHSSVEDLAKWTANFDDPAVGGPDVVALMRRRGVLNDGEEIAYAFGQSRGNYRGRETWSHTGSWAGYRTVLLRVPEERFGVVILSNLGSYDPTPPAYRVTDMLLGDRLGPEDTAGEGRPAAPEASDPALPEAPPPAALEAYVGAYHSAELDATYRIEVRDGSLVALHRRHGTIALSPRGADEFAGSAWFIPRLDFDRSEVGDVTGFRISQGRSRNLRFERTPGTGGR